MLWKIFCLTAIVAGSAVASDVAQCRMKSVFVDVHDRAVIEQNAARLKVSPVLLAVRESGGILRGSEPRGKRVIIEAPAEGIEKLQSSKAVKSVSMDIPESWNPVSRLKLSYGGENRLTEDELKNLGFKLIEDYRKSSFMIVEPIGEQLIDAKLVSKLEADEKIQFATAVFRVKAVE